MKRLVCVLMAVCVVLASGVCVFAAGLGEALTAPEAGWQRYNDDNDYLQYVGSNWHYQVHNYAFYNDDTTGNWCVTPEKFAIQFRFEGSKFRFVVQNHPQRASNVQVKVDGKIVGTFNQSLYPSERNQTLSYELVGLEYGVHSVELLNMDTNKQFLFDALDIDAAGQLLPYEENADLAVLLGIGEQVQLSVAHDLAENDDYTWDSSNVTTAAVTTSGKVTAISEGLAYISAKGEDGAFDETILVRVVKNPETKRLAIALNVGEKQRLYLTEDSSQVTWTSLDEATAVISETGEVTAVKSGLAILQGEYNGKYHQIYVRAN